jgi:hypothetical protein
MRTKTEIENKLVELYYYINKLEEHDANGYSDNIKEIEKINAEIKTIEWVLTY